MKAEIIYRNLTVDDVRDNRRELIELMEITLRDNITQKYPDTLSKEYVDKIPGYIEDNTAIVIGAFAGDLMVGFIWGYVTHIFDETRVHSYMGAVNPDYRGNGIAKRLMELQFEEAKKRGIYQVEAMVTASNEAAHKWHLKTGFVDDRIKMLKIIEHDDEQ